MSEVKITGGMIISEVIEKYPSTEKVFKKYFGNGCFTCPGSKSEDIDFGSQMHNVDTETVLEELNRTASEG